ncbi:MAG TPA: M56 family metallopeptidase [Verrucomicrobiae bacterium]|nr:M56 family metallopeptidase [Verrucomicrobiae bacterium]
MNSVIEVSRTWAPWLLGKVFWPMLWESSLLIGVLLLLEFGLRRKLRPAIRYALWLAVLVKLVLPPSLALPTGVAWWLRPTASVASTRTTTYTVRYNTAAQPGPAADGTAALAPEAAPPLPLATWAIGGSALVSAVFLACMLLRWRQVARMARGSTPAPDWLNHLLEEARINVGLSSPVCLRLTSAPMSPAVSGFFRPIILLPRALSGRLSAARLRAVLLHELIHLRRRDVWVNCVQSLLQIAYWWHPLLWLANARIRRLREEAVDDAVMLALQQDSPEYAPTLLEVARLALQRPLLSLGLVGILESKTALRRRIERLVEFQTPQKAGLTLVSFLGVGLFAAMAVPMGQAPGAFQQLAGEAAANSNVWPDPRFQGYAQVRLEAEFFVVDTASLRVKMPSLPDNQAPLLVSSNEVGELNQKLRLAHTQPAAAGVPLSFAKFSGGVFRWLVGGASNTGVNYQARDVAGQMIVTGAEVGVAANGSDWAPLFFEVVPWTDGNNLRCDLRISSNGNTNSLQQTEVVLPEDSALVWATPTGPFTGKSELVVLRRQSARGAPQPLPSDLAALRPANTPGLNGLTNGETPATAVLGRLTEARERVQDGKLLFEMGKLDEAEASLKAALKLNPESQTARYYLNVVQAGRNEAEKDHPAARSAPGTVIINAPNSAAPSSEGSRLALYTRVIKVDPETFQQALESVGEREFEAGFGVPVQTNAITPQQVRQFFKTLGLELGPPKTVFFNDREGRLFVRASLQDLNTIESALAVLGITSQSTNAGLSQVRPIQTKTNVAVPLSSSVEKVPVLGDIPIVSRLVQSNSPPAQTAIPPQIVITAKFFTVPAELMPELELETPLNPVNLSRQPKAILSAPKVSVIRQALQSHPDVQLIAQSSVTTLSGRQTEVSIEPDLQSAGATNPPSLSFGVPQELFAITNQPPLSVQLDIVPDTSADQPTIRISGKALVKEFLGYSTPDTFSPPGWDTRQTKGDAVVVSTSPQLVPRFQVCEFSFNAVVWDGQTLLLRGVVGDAGPSPGTGGSRNPPKALLIFITPTLIDAAGNRIQK